MQRNLNRIQGGSKCGPKTRISRSKYLNIAAAPARVCDSRNYILNASGVRAHIEGEELGISGICIGSIFFIATVGWLRRNSLGLPRSFALPRCLGNSGLKRIQQ
jgi:hypothetical protein